MAACVNCESGKRLYRLREPNAVIDDSWPLETLVRVGFRIMVRVSFFRMNRFFPQACLMANWIGGTVLALHARGSGWVQIPC